MAVCTSFQKNTFLEANNKPRNKKNKLKKNTNQMITKMFFIETLSTKNVLDLNGKVSITVKHKEKKRKMRDTNTASFLKKLKSNYL